MTWMTCARAAKLALASGAMLLSTMASAGQTRLWFETVYPPPFAGRTDLLAAPGDAFVHFTQSSGALGVQVNGTYDLRLEPPPTSASLQPGVYESAFGSAFGGSPGIYFQGAWAGCNPQGRFVVLEIAIDAVSQQITRIAADFEARCTDSQGTTTRWGEIRINSDVPLTVEKAPGSTTPDPMLFRGEVLAQPSTLYTSQLTTIYGINAPAPIAIAGGEYSVNEGPFTASPGTVNNRDRVRVRRMSAATPGTAVSATLTVGAASAAFTITTATPGAMQSGIAFEDWNATIVPKFYPAPEWTFTMDASPGSVSVSGTGPGNAVQFVFRAPLGQPIVPGAYEEVYSHFSAVASPTMELNLGFPCAQLRRVVVLEADFTNVPKRFAANIEVACYGPPRPLMREIRINSTIPFSAQTVGTDTLPDAMAFETRNAVRAGSLQVSNETIVYGINVAVPISITNGEYSLNGGPYTAVPGTASNFDRLRVRTKASPVPGETRAAVLQVGDRTTTYTVNTYGPGASVSGLYFKRAGSEFSSGFSNFFPAPASLITRSANANSVSVILKSVRSSDEYHIDFKAPGANPIVLGAYENAQRIPFQPAGSAGLSFMAFAFNPISCNTLTGRFVVQEISFAGDGTLQRFAADFEQRCGEFPNTLHVGQVRFNSTVAFGFDRGRYVGLDVSGEGVDDLLWQHTDGRHAAWLMNGLTPTSTAEILAAGSGWNVTHTGDFNADGRTDLLWQHPDGRMAIWLMNGMAPGATQQLLDAGGRTVLHVADLNGDGKPDLVLRNADGTTAVWIMDGLTVASQSTLVGTGGGWSVAKTGDFDGDGKADLVWKHTDGRVAIWLMDGTSVKATNQILNAAAGWSPVHAADLDGDGKSDIVWQHTDGTIAAWRMNGTTMASGSGILGAGSGWSVARTADFDGDGRSDLYFEHSDGRAAIWLMEGLKATQQTQILNAGSGWSLRRIADLNADGKADIVWRHTDGRHAAWLMDGVAMTSGQGILGPGTGWSVLGETP